MSRVSRHSHPPMARFVHASRVRLERIHREEKAMPSFLRTRLPIDNLDWWKHLFRVLLITSFLVSAVILVAVWLFLLDGKDELLMSFLVSRSGRCSVQLLASWFTGSVSRSAAEQPESSRWLSK